MPSARGLGKTAENRAADFLLGKGYTIVTRGFTVKGGEIDIIALDGDVLVFVEVKARSRPDDLAELAVNQVKAERLGFTSRRYLELIGDPDRSCRYDLIAVTPAGIRHLENAFSLL